MLIPSLLLFLAALPSPASSNAGSQNPAATPQAPEAWARAVEQGRALIAEGKSEEARLLLQAADQADAGALRTRVWYIRALIEDEFLNDALNFTDDLGAAGHEGPQLDYLYGMSFVYKARKYIRQSVDLSMVGMNFRDAIAFLASATSADPVRYGDAFLPLAEAAWNSQQLDVARQAAASATRFAPKSGAAFYMLGEIAFSQYVVANADEALAEEAQGHWQTTFDAFQTAAKLEDRDAGDEGLLASSLNKAGDALVWVGRKEEAATQYARALGASPAAVDIGQLYRTLDAQAFDKCITQGEAEFNQRHDPADPGDATLLWWIGYTKYARGEYEEARTEFEKAYAKWPASASSKWYVALCHHQLGDIEAATDTVIALQAADAVALNEALIADPSRTLPFLDILVAHCFAQGRLTDAGRLSAAQGNASPDTPRYWNNVGLFYRDAGVNLPRAADGKAVEDQELQRKYFEKSYEGYSRALALAADDPLILNDTAVVLHYFLDRDLERARKMYALANELSRNALKTDMLTAEERPLIQKAMDDSSKNLVIIDRTIAERAQRRKAQDS